LKKCRQKQTGFGGTAFLYWHAAALTISQTIFLGYGLNLILQD
jgi:hypothetical protein